MSCNKVELYVYDLSKGMAAIMSPLVMGKKIDGIWHTSVVVYEREYFFGSSGVENCSPGATPLGQPLEKIVLGETQIPYPVFIDYLNGLGESSYGRTTYNLFSHNCNNFSDELAQFLCGTGIPKHILELPSQVLQTSRSNSFLLPFVEQLEQSLHPVASEQGSRTRADSPELETLNAQIEKARYNSFLNEERRKRLNEKLAKKDRKREKKRKRLLKAGYNIEPDIDETSIMADAEQSVNVETPLPSEQAMQMEEEEKRQEEERKRNREPPIIYKNTLDITEEFDALVGLIDGKLNQDEQTSLEELHKFMLEDEGSWVLGENFLVFVGRILNDKALPVETRIHMLNVLAVAALKEDVILLLHQDRRNHILMNFAHEIDRHSHEEQVAIATFVCNMFENPNSSEWLLYISEWNENNQQMSNIRVTTKVAVHSLLAGTADLQERGTAIIHNLACKEVKTVVFDDVAVELSMALLEFLQSKPTEENLFRCMKSLARFIRVSQLEVPQLIQIIGPDPNIFKGTSERIDILIDQIAAKQR